MWRGVKCNNTVCAAYCHCLAAPSLHYVMVQYFIVVYLLQLLGAIINTINNNDTGLCNIRFYFCSARCLGRGGCRRHATVIISVRNEDQDQTTRSDHRDYSCPLLLSSGSSCQMITSSKYFRSPPLLSMATLPSTSPVGRRQASDKRSLARVHRTPVGTFRAVYYIIVLYRYRERS